MKRILPHAFFLAITASSICAQPQAPRLPEAERTRWFREAKFGMFIHWGVYSVIGRHEWARHIFQIPQSTYDTYAHRFNPVHYDPDSWVDLARQAGVRYIVITSKHHDGFALWRSKVSDYDMKITPYKGDPLKMLAGACQRKGIRLGFYYSIMDWHHPDYIPKRDWEVTDPRAGGNLGGYIDFMKAQLGELLTGFGGVAVLWFDGEWEHTTREMRSDEIYDFVRSLQPNTLINDRLFKREPGSRADFGTPEQFVPATGLKSRANKPVLWESCITINADSWGYNKYETEFKTSRDLIRMLIEVVSKGGNLLLNVGPMPDGRIPDEFVSRLKAIGAWMKVNGESIYGSTASPFERFPFFGRATVKGNNLYLHVFQWPVNGRLRVPGLRNHVKQAFLLAQPSMKLVVSRQGQDVIVTLPKEAPDEIASVVVLVLDGTPDVAPFIVRPNADGVIELSAESCEIETLFGQRAKKENFLDHVFVTQWTRSEDVPTWTFSIPAPGRYGVKIIYGAGRESEGASFEIVAGTARLGDKIQPTPNALIFQSRTVGEMTLEAGVQKLQVKVAGIRQRTAMNLEKVLLEPLR